MAEATQPAEATDLTAANTNANNTQAAEFPSVWNLIRKFDGLGGKSGKSPNSSKCPPVKERRSTSVASGASDTQANKDREPVALGKAEMNNENAKCYRGSTKAVPTFGAEAEAQPEAQAETQPEAKAETQPEAEAETQPEAEAETQPEAKAETQPEAEAETQPEAEVETKPEAEVETKPEAKAETKPEAEVETKLGVEAETQPEAEAETKPQAVRETKPEAEAEAKPEIEAEIMPETETETQSEAKLETMAAENVARVKDAAARFLHCDQSDEEVAADDTNFHVDSGDTEFDEAVEELEKDDETLVMKTATISVTSAASTSASESSSAAASAASATVPASSAASAEPVRSLKVVHGATKPLKKPRHRRDSGAAAGGSACNSDDSMQPKKRRPLLSNCARTFKNKVLDASRSVRSFVTRADDQGRRTRAIPASPLGASASVGLHLSSTTATSPAAVVATSSPLTGGSPDMQEEPPKQTPPSLSDKVEPALRQGDSAGRQENNSGLTDNLMELQQDNRAQTQVGENHQEQDATCGSLDELESAIISWHTANAATAARVSFVFTAEHAASGSPFLTSVSSSEAALLSHFADFAGFGEGTTFFAVADGESLADDAPVASFSGADKAVAMVTSIHAGTMLSKAVTLPELF